MGNHFSIRAVDVLVISVLAGTSQWFFKGPTLLHTVIGSIFVLLAVVVFYFSYSTAFWISRLHETHRDIDGTSVRHMRKTGRKLPCPYPDAWYAVAMTEELYPGTVRPVTVCSHNLIVFRPHMKKGYSVSDRNNWPAPAILDAYCSHLGAHLAIGGGMVQGDCVRCPFHGWCFGTDGQLKSVPSSDTLPSNSATMAIASWPCKEQNGVISVWMNSRMHTARFIQEAGTKKAHDAVCSHDGDASSSSSSSAKKPSKDTSLITGDADAALEMATKASTFIPNNDIWFQIPIFDKVNGLNPAYKYHGYTENIVNAVLFEIPENGSDICHLHVLHKEFIIPALSPFITHKWNASWKDGSSTSTPDNPRTHIADICVDEQICVYDIPIPGEVHVKITQCGPSQVYLDMQTPVGPVIIVETVTPVAPMQLRVLHAIYAGAWVPRIIAKAILYSTVVQFEKDVPVWCNKKYMPSASNGAQLLTADSSIKVYRNWIRRFWDPEKSITFDTAAKQYASDALGLPLDTTGGLQW